MNNNNNRTIPKVEQFPYPPSPPPPPNSTSSPPPPATPTIMKKKWPFPSGIRFCPRDEELLVDYLAKKIKNLPLPCDYVINDVMLYHYTPDHLAALYEEMGDKEWYFFSQREKKYKGGSRPNRAVAAGCGYWKASGVGKPVRDDEGVVVGFKRSLVFCKGKAGSGYQDRTNWLMHEYFMDKSHIELMGNADNSSSMRLDWVLCRIYNKDYKKGGDLYTVLSPQPISSVPPHQNSEDVDGGDSGQTPWVLEYGGEGIATREERKPDYVMRAKEYMSLMSDTSDIYGLPTATCPQSLASVPQQQNSKVESDTGGGSGKKPPHVMGYGGEGISTKEEIKNNDVMGTPEYVTVSASGDICDIQPLASAPLQQHSEVVSTRGGSGQKRTWTNVSGYGGEGIATKEEMKPKDVMRAPEYGTVGVTTDMFIDENVDWFKELEKLLGQCNPPGFDDFCVGSS